MTMTLTITLTPEIEARFREEAAREGLPLEQLTARRLLEAELLWRIHSAVPESETRLLHRLMRRRRTGRITEAESVQLQMILDARELRGAQRLQDLTQLSHLRSIPIHQLMEQLGIRPIHVP